MTHIIKEGLGTERPLEEVTVMSDESESTDAKLYPLPSVQGFKGVSNSIIGKIHIFLVFYSL